MDRIDYTFESVVPVTFTTIYASRLCFSATENRQLIAWDLRSKMTLAVMIGHERRITAVDTNVYYIASCDEAGTMHVWCMNTFKLLKTFKGDVGEHFTCVKIRNEFEIVTGSNLAVKWWKMEKEGCIRSECRHMGAVNGIACFSGIHTFKGQSYKTLISVGDDSNVQVSMMKYGEESSDGKRLQGHAEKIIDVDVNANTNMAATIGKENTLRIWDLSTMKIKKILRSKQQNMSCVTFDSTGTLCAVGSSSGIICVWHVGAGRCISVANAKIPIYKLSFYHDPRFNSTHLFATTYSQLVSSWNIVYSLNNEQWHTEPIYALAYSANTNELASADAFGKIIVSNTLKRDTVVKILMGHTDMVSCLSFGQDGTFLVSGSEDHTVMVWNVQEAAAVMLFTKHIAPIVNVKCIGDMIVSVGKDAVLYVWDVQVGVPAYKMTLDGSDILAATISNTMAFVSSDFGTITSYGWTTNTKTTFDKYEDQFALFALSYNPATNTLMGAGTSNHIVAYNLTSMHRQLIPTKAKMTTNALDAFADDHVVYGCEDGLVGYDSHHGCDHGSPVYAVATNPKDQCIYSAGQDAIIRCWDIKTRRHLTTFPENAPPVMHKEQEHILCLFDNSEIMFGQVHPSRDYANAALKEWISAFVAEEDGVKESIDAHPFTVWSGLPASITRKRSWKIFPVMSKFEDKSQVVKKLRQ